ncbi:MAG TPA: redoxin domain-containing protein [Chloroflexota bacterium]|nr:redoxin domain-containing protein [Chloroflexota bacterium]
MTQFGLDRDEFKQLDAEVIAGSADSVFTLNEFGNQTKFGWPLISDWNHEIATQYDSSQDLPNGMRGICKRTVFVIDRQGIIRYQWQSEGGALPNDEEILAAIRAIPA